MMRSGALIGAISVLIACLLPGSLIRNRNHMSSITASVSYLNAQEATAVDEASNAAVAVCPLTVVCCEPWRLVGLIFGFRS